MSMPQSSTLLSKSAEGATFLIVLQVGSRALTFAVNQLLLRYLSPELLGVSTQLEVYSISVLYFAREALRVAIQRQTDSPGNVSNDVFKEKSDNNKYEQRQKGKPGVAKTQTVVNLAYISIALGIFFAFALARVYRRSLQSHMHILETPYFNVALQLYTVATLLELLSEPCFVVVQQKSEYKVRAAAESAATVTRCLATCGAVILAARGGLSIGVLPFALGQLAYSLALLSVYYGKVWAISSIDGFSLIIRKIPSKDKYVLSYFSRQLLTLGASLFIQGIVKHLLTQGDVILISSLASLQAQGVYALASNYGGLVARMVFQPIEESSRNYFGKLLSTIDGPPSKDVVKSASRDLHNLLRFYGLLSISAATVGPTVAPLLLKLVAGSRWTSSGAGDVLAKYCYYIPLLAVNGITEAFISAVSSESELNRQSLWMLTFSAGFAGAGYIFLRVLEMGAEGLVWANVINMALRIVWSCNFINFYLQRNGSNLSILAVMPKAATVTLSAGTAAVLAKIQNGFTGGMMDFVKSGFVAACFVALLAVSERQYLQQCYRSIRKSKSTA